jgi:hypothetical protein
MPRLALLPLAVLVAVLLAILSVWLIGALGLGAYAPSALR